MSSILNYSIQLNTSHIGRRQRLTYDPHAPSLCVETLRVATMTAGDLLSISITNETGGGRRLKRHEAGQVHIHRTIRRELKRAVEAVHDAGMILQRHVIAIASGRAQTAHHTQHEVDASRAHTKAVEEHREVCRKIATTINAHIAAYEGQFTNPNATGGN